MTTQMTTMRTSWMTTRIHVNMTTQMTTMRTSRAEVLEQISVLDQLPFHKSSFSQLFKQIYKFIILLMEFIINLISKICFLTSYLIQSPPHIRICQKGNPCCHVSDFTSTFLKTKLDADRCNVLKKGLGNLLQSKTILMLESQCYKNMLSICVQTICFTDFPIPNLKGDFYFLTGGFLPSVWRKNQA